MKQKTPRGYNLCGRQGHADDIRGVGTLGTRIGSATHARNQFRLVIAGTCTGLYSQPRKQLHTQLTNKIREKKLGNQLKKKPINLKTITTFAPPKPYLDNAEDDPLPKVEKGDAAVIATHSHLHVQCLC